MPQIKVSALTALTATDGAEELLINDGGISKKVTIDNVLHDNSIRSEHYVDGSIDTAHFAAGSVDATAMGANSVDSSELVNGSVDLSHMSANSVDSDQYVDGSIDAIHLSANSVDSASYVDGSIDEVHLSDNSVDSRAYVDGSIDHVHLAADCIDGDNIQNDVINSEHIAANSIDAEHYAAGSVDATALGANSVDSSELVDGSVDTSHLSADCVTTAKIADNVALGGSPTTTTQAESDDSTKIATTAYVVDKITTLIGGAPSTLNDLNELAAAINDDANYNSTLTTALATKLPLAGGAITGAITTNSTFDGRDVAADGVTADAALPKAGGTMTGDLILPDNVKLEIGSLSGGDLQIYHDGSNSYIDDAGTGDLILRGTSNVRIQNGTGESMFTGQSDGAVYIYYNNSTKLHTTATGVIVTGNVVVSGTVDGIDIASRDAVLTSTTATAAAALPKAGGTMTGDLNFADNAKARFGAGNDLQIWHDGSNSYIKDHESGSLFIQGSTTVTIEDTGGNNMAVFNDGGSVDLYHGAGKKLETTATGVAVTGGVALGGTGAANTLSDYEIGTFTATLTATTGLPNTAVTATGNYTKVGRQVSVYIDFNNKDTTGASGNIRVTGLPFSVAVSALGSYLSYGVVAYTANSINTATQFVAGDTYVQFMDNITSGAWQNSTIVAGNSKYLYLSGTYYTS